MVALLREFPDVRMTFNLVPSLLVQLEAFAADRAHDRYLELEPEAGRRADRRRTSTSSSQNFFHAQRQRMIDVYPRYAELLAQRGGTAPTAADRRAAAARLHRRRPARPAGLAEAGVDRPVLSRRRRARPRAGREGPRLHRGRQGDCCATVELELLNTVDPRVPRRGGARADRDLDLAVLSPDPAAAVRHRHLPAHPSRVADAAPAVHASRGCARAAASARSPITSGCSAGGRSGSGRRKGRCPTRWCRSSPPPGSSGWRPTS